MLLVSAVVLIVVLLSGPLGHKFGFVEVQPSLVSVLVALVGGLLVFLAGLVYVVIAIRNDLPKDRNMVAIAMVVSLIPAAFVVPQMMKGSSVPSIHDITTDTDNPPAFVAVVPIREATKAANPVAYGVQEGMTPAEVAEATRTAYPDLKPINSALSVNDAVAKAEAVLASMGLEIVDVDAASGRVEATATTFWYGFKDDVVVRIVADGDGSIIDLRSKSRVGLSDIGANADRIREFVSRF